MKMKTDQKCDRCDGFLDRFPCLDCAGIGEDGHGECPSCNGSGHMLECNNPLKDRFVTCHAPETLVTRLI